MSSFWKESKNKLHTFKCIEHTVSGELALSGRYGEIWCADAFTCKAIIYSARVAKRFLPKDQHPVLPGDETLISFPVRDLPIWIDRLAVPTKPSTQAALANQAKSNIEDLNGEILSLEAKDESKPGKPTLLKPLSESFDFEPRSESSAFEVLGEKEAALETSKK